LLTGISVARNAVDVVLRGDRAAVELRGLDLPVGDDRHDTAVTVEHAASHGQSRQLFKAAVDDHARASFSGRVIVAPGTAGTDADQTSRGLLLAPTAQADTRPWLEIFSDDVRCTHGSSVGRLDRDGLFYLRARGVPEAQARSMLVGGFIAEMTDAIELPSLRAVVSAAIGVELGARP
jgi:Fe-S cluster assembly protein SufD